MNEHSAMWQEWQYAHILKGMISWCRLRREGCKQYDFTSAAVVPGSFRIFRDSVNHVACISSKSKSQITGNSKNHPCPLPLSPSSFSIWEKWNRGYGRMETYQETYLHLWLISFISPILFYNVWNTHTLKFLNLHSKYLEEGTDTPLHLAHTTLFMEDSSCVPGLEACLLSKGL